MKIQLLRPPSGSNPAVHLALEMFDLRSPTTVDLRMAIGIGSTEVNFPSIEQYLGPLGLNERDADPGAVRMVETLASNLKAAYFKHPDVRLVIQPGANHSSQFWAQRLPAAIQFLYGEAAFENLRLRFALISR